MSAIMKQRSLLRSACERVEFNTKRKLYRMAKKKKAKERKRRQRSARSTASVLQSGLSKEGSFCFCVGRINRARQRFGAKTFRKAKCSPDPSRKRQDWGRMASMAPEHNSHFRRCWEAFACGSEAFLSGNFEVSGIVYGV